MISANRKSLFSSGNIINNIETQLRENNLVMPELVRSMEIENIFLLDGEIMSQLFAFMNPYLRFLEKLDLTNNNFSFNFDLVNNSFQCLKCLHVRHNNMSNLLNIEKVVLYLKKLFLIDVKLKNFNFQLNMNIKQIVLTSNDLSKQVLDFNKYKRLKHISLNYCNLEICPEVELCDNLSYLDISCNHITELKKLPDSIKELYINTNLIRQLDFVPINIVKLNLFSNPLTRLPRNILMCTSLIYGLDLSHTEIVLTAPEMRFLERIERITNQSISRNQIYNDAQNVHASAVQKSILISIQNLFLDKFPDVSFETTGNPSIDKIIYDNFKCMDVHSVLLFSYKEIFQKVWNRISHCECSNMKKELMKRLKEEIFESESKCFTGQITRLLNVFVGFYSDISINISDADQIYARIMTIIKKNNGVIVESEIYDSLREIEVDDSLIKEWIENLSN
jgi:hypothetical protein